MSEFLTPRLLITEYYDSLINHLDIYTEKRINECKEKDQREDKLNEARQKAIDTIIKVRDENLEFYNDNKDDTEMRIKQVKEHIQNYQELESKKKKGKHYSTRANKTDIKGAKSKVQNQNLPLEEIKSILFANRFCFLLDIEKLNRKSTDRKSVESSLFNLCTVVTDFYLRESDIDYIRDERKYNKRHYKKRFDQRLLIAYQLAKHIRDGLTNGFDVIHVKRNSLFHVKNINIYFDRKFDEFDFLFDIDFSAITYLHININNRISDFSAFANLEYLSISRVVLCERPFENLHKLIKIQLESCDLSQFDFDSLNSIASLQAIDIEMYTIENNLCPLKIDLNKLINLKCLRLAMQNETNFELIQNSLNQLNAIRLIGKTIIDFSKQHEFNQLKSLEIVHVDLLSKQISQQWFDGMTNLIELELTRANLVNFDFITDQLHKLEKLNLSRNLISELKKGAFSKLKSLKHLNLEYNAIQDLVPGTFDGLECLEHLNLDSNRFRFQSIDKAVFDGLKCLKFLGIDIFKMKSYDDVVELKKGGLRIF